MNFRRYYIPGSAVFITQVVQDRNPVFRDPQAMRLLYEIFHNVQQLHPFTMLGYSFLFEHFHVIIQPTGTAILVTLCIRLNLISPKNIRNLSGSIHPNP